MSMTHDSMLACNCMNGHLTQMKLYQGSQYAPTIALCQKDGGASVRTG